MKRSSSPLCPYNTPTTAVAAATVAAALLLPSPSVQQGASLAAGSVLLDMNLHLTVYLVILMLILLGGTFRYPWGTLAYLAHLDGWVVEILTGIREQISGSDPCQYQSGC